MNTNTWNLLTEDNQIFAKGYKSEEQAYRAIIANKRLSCDGCDVIKCKLHISKA